VYSFWQDSPESVLHMSRMLDLYRLQSCSRHQLLAFGAMVPPRVEKMTPVVRSRLKWTILTVDEDDP
jgi:hypothetical protein